MNFSEFYKITLPLETNLFDELSNSIDFETINKGRIANNLVLIEKNRVPIVRTTSKYNIPAQNFLEIHKKIIKLINQNIIANNLTNIPFQHFNNALIEIYGLDYSKMGFHSDQCLDIEKNSFIGIFSCYENPDILTAQNIRKLKIRNKITNEEFEFSLTHNSVILFSIDTNFNFKHKIVLDIDPKSINSTIENKWLGITFRTSKTYLEFKNNLPFFTNGVVLQIANKDQEKEFFKYKGEENKSLNFNYPFLNYTISLADTLFPKMTRDVSI